MKTTKPITESQRAEVVALLAKTKAQVSDKTREGREIILSHFLKVRRRVTGRADFVLSTGGRA